LESAKEVFAWPIEPVCTGKPIADQIIHKTEALTSGLGA